MGENKSNISLFQLGCSSRVKAPEFLYDQVRGIPPDKVRRLHLPVLLTINFPCAIFRLNSRR
jgi:hypothetical protein